MQLPFHKPNSKNTGFLFGFKTNQGSLFLEAIRQVSWNDQTKNGSFKANAKSKDPQKKIVIKMNAIEAGGLLKTLNSQIPFSTVHRSEQGQTAISVYKMKRNVKIGQNEYEVDNVSFNVSKDGSKMGILLNVNEIEAFKIFLVEYIKEVISTDKFSNTDGGETPVESGQEPEKEEEPSKEPSPKTNATDDFGF